MLKELLTADFIRCLPCAEDWRTAIRICAKPLVGRGNVTAGYVDAMVRSVEQNGPYIVIDEGLALPHARPEQGAKKLGMSLLLLSQPVDLLGNPVCVFAALAAVDNSSHLDAMREFAQLIWNGCDAKTLSAAKTPEEALAVINKFSEEQK